MISLRLFIAVMTVTTVWLSFIPYSIFLYRIRSSRGPKQAEENEPPQVKRSVATKRWDLLGIQSEEDTAVESPTSTSEIMSPIPLSLWRCTEQLQIDHNQNCVNVSEDVLLKNNSNLNFECEQELRPTTFITKLIAFSGKFSITDLSADSVTESVKSFSAEVYYQVKKTKHLIVQLEYNSGTPDRRMFSSVLPYLKSEKVKVRFAGSVHAPIRFCLHDMVGILQPSYILTAPEPNPVENIMSDFPFSKYPPTLIQIVGHHGLSFLRDQESSCLHIINRPSLIRDSRFIAFFMRVAILKQQKFSVRARISVQRRVQDANVSFLLMFQKGIEPNIKKSFLLGEYSKVLETSTHEKPFAKGADVLELAGTGSFRFINLFLRVELQNNLKFNENEQLVSLCHSFLSVSPKS